MKRLNHEQERAGLADLHTALSTAASARQAARWLAASGFLGYLGLAQEIAREDTTKYDSLPHLDDWTAVH